jgi:hypothetical protein
MKENSDRESEPEKWVKWIIDSFQIRFWAVKFLSKFQSDPTVRSKVTLFFVKHAHIASTSLIFYLCTYILVSWSKWRKLLYVIRLRISLAPHVVEWKVVQLEIFFIWSLFYFIFYFLKRGKIIVRFITETVKLQT